jgi:hypothetical protein
VRPHSNERLSKHAPISYSCEPSGVVFKLWQIQSS